MSKKFRNLFALICAAAVLAGQLCISAAAAETDGESDPVVLECTEVPLYTNDEYIGSGILLDSVTYVPLLTFTELMLPDECTAEWDQETGTAAITADGLTIMLTVSDGYMTANGRYIYFEDGAYNINGTIMVPLRELARIFGLEVSWNEEDWSVTLDTSGLLLLEPGTEFYDEDALYWLSHVIYSEAGNQPLEGMIGVGNVVLNRLYDDSGAFSDTLYGVIFQSGQFDVVRSGSIYLSPSESAVVAAKLCLEGYNTVGDSKWFVNPKIGTTKWFDAHKTLTVEIADHNFYA